jgi:hypothetical protein
MNGILQSLKALWGEQTTKAGVGSLIVAAGVALANLVTGQGWDTALNEYTPSPKTLIMLGVTAIVLRGRKPTG